MQGRLAWSEADLIGRVELDDSEPAGAPRARFDHLGADDAHASEQLRQRLIRRLERNVADVERTGVRCTHRGCADDVGPRWASTDLVATEFRR